MQQDSLFCIPHSFSIHQPRLRPSDWIAKDAAGFVLDGSFSRLVNNIKIDFDWYTHSNGGYSLVRSFDVWTFVQFRGLGYLLPITCRNLADAVKDNIGSRSTLKCSNCKFFAHHADIVERVEGDCRRLPPKPSSNLDRETKRSIHDRFNKISEHNSFSLDDYSFEVEWPTVYEDHWCGEHSTINNLIGGLGRLT